MDTDGYVKLWRPCRVIATYATPIEPGRTYHLRVTAEGSRIRMYLDDGPEPVIDALDDTYAEGALRAQYLRRHQRLRPGLPRRFRGGGGLRR